MTVVDVVAESEHGERLGDSNISAPGNAQDYGCEGVIDHEHACGAGQFREKFLHGTLHLFPGILFPEGESWQHVYARLKVIL